MVYQYNIILLFANKAEYAIDTCNNKHEYILKLSWVQKKKKMKHLLDSNCGDSICTNCSDGFADTVISNYTKLYILNMSIYQL